MSQQQGGQVNNHISGGSDENLFFMMIVVGFIIVVSSFYWIWKPEFFTLKMYQFRFMDMITGGNISFIHDWRVKLDNTQLNEWEFSDMLVLSYYTDYLVALPFVMFLNRAKKHIENDLFLYLKLRNRNLHVTDRKAGLNALQRIGDYVTSPEKAGMYDLIKPVWGLNLLDQDPREGGWASARRPHDIAARYGLLKEAKNPDTLDEKLAERYFMSQLGRPYLRDKDNPHLSDECLSDYHKAILGVVLALMERKKSAGEMARNAIARSFDAKQKVIKPDFSAGIELYEKYKNSPIAAHIFEQHAYVNTLMYSMFKYAKNEVQVGVLVAHHFIWLKPIDRVLYYALNNEGSKVEWTECAGVILHANYEIGMGKPLRQPYVKDCIVAFREELGRVIPEVVVDTKNSNKITVDGISYTTISDKEFTEGKTAAEEAKEAEEAANKEPEKKSFFRRFF